MVWFKVDDTLHAHPKMRQVGLSAIGLWVTSGSWAAQYASDGWVPNWFVIGWPNGRRLATQLVAAGLWEAEEVDGEKGWRFHDWGHYQPTRAEIEADREAARDRQRRHRERKREAKRGDVSRVTNGVTNGVSHSTPARPGPTRPVTEEEQPPPDGPDLSPNAVLTSHGMSADERRAFLADLKADAGVRSVGGLITGMHRKGTLAARIAEWRELRDIPAARPAPPRDRQGQILAAELERAQAADAQHANVFQLPVGGAS